MSNKKHKTREQLNAEGKERKQQKKRRGNQAGTRNSLLQAKSERKQLIHNKVDPRKGSKKPILLTAANTLKVNNLTPEEELVGLENDILLEQLLDKLDNGELLSLDDQHYVDTQLARIELLMNQLGIDLNDD